jgi:predicted metalloprotease with PDZ domain
VKRLRPHELARYDYDRENHTELLWFFEGFTSYYDDLLLRRAGLIDDATYLQLLAKTVNQVQQTPGRRVQSVAQASFDAWTKYYRVQENTPNATVSYYTKGSLVALCLDLTLRAEGHTTLDAVMRALYERCQGGPMKASDVLAVLKRLGKRSSPPRSRPGCMAPTTCPWHPCCRARACNGPPKPRPWPSAWACA